nr:MAG TPA: Protein of unknown function (DUF1642) [Caudoviricetes sp.]
MKVQRLIEKYKELYENVFDFGAKLACQLILQDLEQLDEPEKVKVPQCVHKYIQEAKEYNWDLQDLMKSIDGEDSEDLQRWFYHECNQETLARAWLDGYEVEEEKRYLVSLKNGQPLTKTQSGKALYFNQNIITGNYKFTRKELEEAGFGWVFDCPGIEIEEVE